MSRTKNKNFIFDEILRRLKPRDSVFNNPSWGIVSAIGGEVKYVILRCSTRHGCLFSKEYLYREDALAIILGAVEASSTCAEDINMRVFPGLYRHAATKGAGTVPPGVPLPICPAELSPQQ